MALALASTGLAFEPVFHFPAASSDYLRCPRDLFNARLDCRSVATLVLCGGLCIHAGNQCFPIAHLVALPDADFLGARQFVETHVQNGDAVVAIGIAGSGYQLYYWRDILVENRVSAIQALMINNSRVWLLYTFKPDTTNQCCSKLMKFALDNFVEQQVFPGMVVDGEIDVSLFSRPSVTAN